ncbi:MAG: allophanate hydrolase [Myxococcota bacterium]|nr:allophanate hydrolase [Myxococcota bacterium]
MDFGDVAGFARRCARGELRLSDVAAAAHGRAETSGRPEVWIARLSRAELDRRAAELDALLRERGEDVLETHPLFGVPFAVKDNIDAAGLPTTAGCPAYARVPERSAPAVERLIEAGAILVGKTHMDQFATGLVGTRSPLGPCRNAYDASVISGGSSSGSAVAVALDLVGFALGTDTAGSGRVPAALNGLTGFKPSIGRIPTQGVVPACRSLDCVSIFARGPADARRVLEVVAPGADLAEPGAEGPFSFGVPDEAFLAPLDPSGRDAFERARSGLESLGGKPVPFDARVFAEVAALLYDGPFVAERHQAVGAFAAAHPEAIEPSVAAILRGAAEIDPTALEAGFRDLEPLRARALQVFDRCDTILLPTIPRAPSIEEVLRAPLAVNTELGRFTNFMNLIGLCGAALPVCMGEVVPAGVTLMAPDGTDARVLRRAEALAGVLPPLPPPEAAARRARIPLCVVGAHLRDMPLNHQLTGPGGEFVRAVRTSPDYRLWHLKDSEPPKPGLERVAEGGQSIDAEIWALPADAFGRFVDAVPRPLAIGHVTLSDGECVAGFVCEGDGLAGARDVSHFGGWRAYLGSGA